MTVSALNFFLIRPEPPTTDATQSSAS